MDEHVCACVCGKEVIILLSQEKKAVSAEREVTRRHLKMLFNLLMHLSAKRSIGIKWQK